MGDELMAPEGQESLRTKLVKHYMDEGYTMLSEDQRPDQVKMACNIVQASLSFRSIQTVNTDFQNRLTEYESVVLAGPVNNPQSGFVEVVGVDILNTKQLEEAKKRLDGAKNMFVVVDVLVKDR
ncbi:hypothetical protein JW978_02055 [Candidatus Dojkabacteria bacterium]|nr:hypothetical protein [Candidatus Dojkabacteria bacterium]